MQPTVTKLKIIREKSRFGSVKSIFVYIDGQEVGKLSKEQTLELNIEEGNYSLKCSMGDILGIKTYLLSVLISPFISGISKNCPFTIMANETKTKIFYVRVKDNYSLTRIIFALLMLIILCNTKIYMLGLAFIIALFLLVNIFIHYNILEVKDVES